MSLIAPVPVAVQVAPPVAVQVQVCVLSCRWRLHPLTVVPDASADPVLVTVTV